MVYDEAALECEFAECRTFGSVIRFALDLEITAISFYEQAKNRGIAKGPVSDIFTSFAKDHAKRKDLLEHTRREKLNEMILEPISEIDNAKYKPKLQLLDSLDEKSVLNQAIEIEEKAVAFFSDTSVIAKSLLAEVARIFIKMAKENQEKISKLKSVQ